MSETEYTYIYIQEMKGGKEIRHKFSTPAEAIGFGNMNYQANPSIKKDYIIKTKEQDPDLSTWIEKEGEYVKVYQA